MSDPRLERLARVITGYSTRLQPGERVLIETCDVPSAVPVALVRAARAAGAIPFVQLHEGRVDRELALGATAAQYRLLARHELARMKRMDAYIVVRGAHNITELADVPGERLQAVAKAMRPVIDHRIRRTKWVVLRWPTPAMAQLAGMSTAQFEDFFFAVCTLDYGKLLPAMNALKARLERTDRVEIRGPGTDLRFSVKGVPAVVCGGTLNLPDGEVFTAPVRDSAEGHVTFNVPTIYRGTLFDNVRLELRRGRIVGSTASDPARIRKILAADGGARFLGEFALGFNPRILRPMRDTLFDEKIAGSFHLTPGQAYEEADNGNRSQIHWDLVCIQRPEYGGGTIHFDGELVRRDGRFLPPELRPLNPPRAGSHR